MTIFALQKYGRWLVLLVPFLGILELALHRWFATRAPSLEEWRELRTAVLALRSQQELLVVAPRWAEPLARHALGPEAFPLAQVGRPDNSAFRRAIEISILGAHEPELANWHPLSTQREGKFTLQVLENPAAVSVQFDFVDGLGPDQAQVFLGQARQPCPYTRSAPQRAGGLHGHSAFPAQRFACPAAEHLFAGVTVIDDQQYRPRRCIWAHPPGSGLPGAPSANRPSLAIHYSKVPLGRVIRGYGGLSWFLMRDGVGTPVELEIWVEGELLGQTVHQDTAGWSFFEVPTGRHRGTTRDVEFRILSEDARERHFCFQADTR